MLKQGLAISLLRDSLQQASDINRNSRNEIPHIVWSSYDRVEVKNVTSFQEYFGSSFCPNNWIGDVQSLYLYPYNDCRPKESLFFACEDAPEKLFGYETNDNHLFFSIVTVNIAKSFKNNGDIISLVLDRLSEFTALKNIDFQPFISLGTEDLVLIFLGDVISDIIKSIYFLRKIQIEDCGGQKINFCSTTYSVMGKNNSSDITSERCDEDRAIAQISLTLKDNMRASDFVSSLKEKLDGKYTFADNDLIEMLIGEYDIQLTISASDLFLNNLYSKEGVLVADSEQYEKYILCSKTVWFLTQDEIQKEMYPCSVINSGISIEDIALTQGQTLSDVAINNLKNQLTVITNKIAEEEQKNTTEDSQINNNIIAVYQDVILFIKELIKIMNSCMHSEWLNRLISIAEAFNVGIENFFKIMVNSSDIIEISPRIFEKKVLEMNRILCSLRNAISHIYKSGEHFYNVPHPSIYYSGSAHKVLMAYYNFIDMVLSLGYLKPHVECTEQSSISYFITFGMTNKVKTSIYFKTSTAQNNRLVGFELPYAALYDFKKYIPALLHEVYHLIAPTDRKQRNILLLNLSLQTTLKPYITQYMKSLVNSTFDTHNQNTDLVLQTLNNQFLNLDYNDILENCIQALHGFYNIKIGEGDILTLDQVDFIRVLKKFFREQAAFSGFVDSVLNKIDAHFSDEHNKEKVLEFFKNGAFDGDYSDSILEIFSKFNTPETIRLKNEISAQTPIFILEEKFFVAIKETICDVFFIDILDFEVQDYLRYMLDLFSENRIEWTEITYREISVRIGTIISYFYGNIDGNNTEAMNSAKKWLNQKLLNSMFTEEERKSVLKMFVTYVHDFKTQISILKALLQNEIIVSIQSNIADSKLKSIFVQKIKRIKKIYNLLSIGNLEQQLKGILFMQSQIEEIPKKYTIPMICAKGYIAAAPYLQQVYGVSTNGDLGHFLSMISEIKKLYNNDQEDLWFRGICNSTYKLIPSLYRDVPTIPNSNPIKKYVPIGYQSIMIKQAYAQTKVYYQLLEKNENPLAVRHAFLQHYGIKTNFLDFSTNPLASLYWALNPGSEEDQKDVCEAVVYIFSPKRYQMAINTIKQEHGLLSKEDSCYIYHYHTHNCMSDEYVIENMSDESILSQVKIAENYQDDVNKNVLNKYNRLPIATIVPQKNDRILAQSGCFVAYNLLSAKDPENTKEPFNYLSLEEIQNEYLRVCSDGECFLHRILIPVGVQEQLRHSLKTIFDYSLSKVYPDVDKLFADANAEVKEYFKNLSN